MMQTQPQQHNPKTGLSKLSIWCINHSMVCVGLYICLVSLFFLAFPGVDLWASGLFHFGDEASRPRTSRSCAMSGTLDRFLSG